MKVFKAPESYVMNKAVKKVFLAGSIEMGTVIDWQKTTTDALSDYSDDALTVLNPRRDDFDSTQVQSIHNPYFKEQVEWELRGLTSADYVLMYFHPDTQAPITLLELGLYAELQEIIVVCPNGFYRKGNVEIVCDMFNIPLLPTLEEGIAMLRERLDHDDEYNDPKHD